MSSSGNLLRRALSWEVGSGNGRAQRRWSAAGPPPMISWVCVEALVVAVVARVLERCDERVKRRREADIHLRQGEQWST